MLKRANMDISVKKKRVKGSDDSIFKCRYLVAFLEFFAFFYTNMYRIATSISVIAMVNSTAVSSHKVSHNNTISCPLNYSDEMHNELPENDGEFNWSPEIQGYILGSSFLGFVITLIPGGILAETFGAKRIILLGLLISTASHLVSPLAAWSSSYFMIAVQFLRGLSQGLIPAAQSVLSASWFPKSERGFLNSLIYLGYPFGALIGGFSSGFLGLVLCLCFYIFIFESPMCHPRISDGERDFILKDQESDVSLKRPPTPWKSILTSKEVYAMTYAIFGASWASAYFLAVQPIFFGTILHFSVKENGTLTSIPFFFQLTLTFSASWISKWLNLHNYVGVDKVRKGSNLLFCVGYSLCILGVYYAGCDRTLSAALSLASVSIVGLALSGCLITPHDMSPTFVGTLVGYSATLGSLAYFIFPVLVGNMTVEKQTLEEWNKIFLISIGVVMSSGIIFCVFGSSEVQPWNYPTKLHLEKTQLNENNLNEQVQRLKTPADIVIPL